MPPEESFENWLTELRAGDSQAAQAFWASYFPRLVGLARKKFDGQKFALGDEEDVALSAIKSFCRAVEAGRFPHLANENELWALLAKITVRKVYRLRQKSAKDAEPGDVEAVANEDISLEEVRAFTDTLEHLFSMLDDDAELSQVARLRVAETPVKEIAETLGKTERRVKYKLELVRQIWRGELKL